MLDIDMSGSSFVFDCESSSNDRVWLMGAMYVEFGLLKVIHCVREAAFVTYIVDKAFLPARL